MNKLDLKIITDLKHLTAKLALGWRIRLTQHLLKNYLRNNAYYKRITQDLEKFTENEVNLGRRGVAILYAYMLLGLGFLRSVALDFGDLASREQQLEGTFRSFCFIYCYFFLRSVSPFYGTGQIFCLIRRTSCWIPLESLFHEGSIPPTSYNVTKDEQYCGEIRVGLTFTRQGHYQMLSKLSEFLTIHLIDWLLVSNLI
ncbi:ABC transporter D family member 1 [Camellia lanceoleosa]|uniref:ABC transporter D family member 1 n=1 Tax=Camellia lanceoleosa TaxID=1840588 RepID=A0ACC0HWQ7_9ERIC|nr:ABC transporter D family member 1 [Camellia lanceoleosa]